MNRIFRSNQKKEELLGNLAISLEAVLRVIATKYFEKVAKEQVEILVPEDIDKEEYLQNAESDYLRWLKFYLAPRLGKDIPEDNVTQKLADQIASTPGWRLNTENMADLIVELVAVFSRNPEKLQEYQTLTNKQAVAHIVAALQDLTLIIPTRIFGGDESMPESLKEELLAILSEIDQIAKQFELSESLTPYAQLTQQLYRKFALADQYVWLPLVPLVTSPLSARDLVLYARDPQPASRLANSIVRGDGVTLITGYRGVGKSTFVNAVLGDHVLQAEKLQSDPAPWKIIPIVVSVAKASGVENVLRLTIRQLYQVLFSKEYASFLRDDEKETLKWAYKRASFKVDFLQFDSFAASKKIQAAFGLEPAKALSNIPGIGLLGEMLPSFKGEVNKEKQERTDHTISLLDYNEDRAEEDIVNLIHKLAEVRSTPEGSRRIKLAFVFDELDKMDELTGQLPIIKQLKNLFLTRNAVFFLVTSKDFYYLWLKDRKNEDSLLSSYFSSIIMVPIFTSEETEKLVRNLLDLPSDSKLEQPEDTVVKQLAGYLTYRSTGLPREIIRELRLMQEWTSGALQTYITDRTRQIEVIRIYAAIQDALDRLDQQRDAPISINADASSESAEEILAMPEYLWLNEASQEQIRRGRYVFIEEMLNRGSLTLTKERLSAIYQDNFTKKNNNPDDQEVFALVSEDDFLFVTQQLARYLAQEVYYSDTDGKQALFHYEATEDQSHRIIVSDTFYSVTKRKKRPEREEEIIPEARSYSAQQIFEKVATQLKSDSQFVRQSAFRWLNQPQVKGKKFPASLNAELIDLLLSDAPENQRMQTTSYFTGSTFIKATASRPANFLVKEKNQTVLQALFRLLDDAAQAEGNETRVRALCKALIDEIGVVSASWTEALWASFLLVWSKSGLSEDISVIVKALPADEALSDPIFQPLLQVAKTQKQLSQLFSEILQKGYQKIPAKALGNTLSSLTLEETLSLWEILIKNKEKVVAQQILNEILIALPNMSKQVPEPIVGWLNSGSWLDSSNTNNKILRNALGENPALLRYLAQISDQITNAFVRQILSLPSINPVKSKGNETQEKKQSSGTASVTQKTATKRYPAVYFIAFLLVAIGYVYLPFDVSGDANLWTRIVQRILQIVYMWLPIAILGLGALAFGEKDTTATFMMIIFLAIEIWAVWYSITSLGTPFSFTGQLFVFGSQLLGLGAIWGSEPLYRRLFRRTK